MPLWNCVSAVKVFTGNGLVVGEGDFEVGGRGGGAGLVERGFDGFGGGGGVFGFANGIV